MPYPYVRRRPREGVLFRPRCAERVLRVAGATHLAPGGCRVV